MSREDAKACLVFENRIPNVAASTIQDRHPEARTMRRNASRGEPRRATARLHLGRSSFEACSAARLRRRARTSGWRDGYCQRGPDATWPPAIATTQFGGYGSWLSPGRHWEGCAPSPTLLHRQQTL